MIILNGSARFAPGEVQRLRPAMRRWAETVRGRPGCLSYHISVDVEDGDIMHVAERWTDMAAVDVHMADLGVLVDGLAGAEMSWLELTAYGVASERSLMSEGITSPV
jgi:quinol monooxygenase YgiN